MPANNGHIDGEIGVTAWVVDGTDFPIERAHSPGAKRRYSGTLARAGQAPQSVP